MSVRSCQQSFPEVVVLLDYVLNHLRGTLINAEEMRRKRTWALVLVFLLGIGFTMLKLTVPFSYAEAELRSSAIEFVAVLQERGEKDPKECAARYLYFNTDYHSETSSRVRVSMKELSGNRVRVTLYDPSCRDDSVLSSIHRVYLHRSDAGIWVPNRHEWSHTRRGKFGWATDPTC